MIYIICGPPGSGKTTFVKKHAKYGDLIVDVDAIFHALTGLPWYEKPQPLLPLVLSVRDFVVGRIKYHVYKKAFYNAWVITGGASLEYRNRLAMSLEPAQVYVLEVPPGECIRRIFNDERRKEHWERWQDLVYKWWREYKPYSGDNVLKPERTD